MDGPDESAEESDEVDVKKEGETGAEQDPEGDAAKRKGEGVEQGVFEGVEYEQVRRDPARTTGGSPARDRAS